VVNKATTKLEGIKERLGVFMLAQDMAGIPPETEAASISIGGKTYLLVDDVDFLVRMVDRYEAYRSCPCEAHMAQILTMRHIADAQPPGGTWGWRAFLKRLIGK
jgi:hypothetical protein